MARNDNDGPNPDFNRPVRMPDEELKAWLLRYHSAAGSIGHYYDVYPSERPGGWMKTRNADPLAPPEKPRRSRGRGGR